MDRFWWLDSAASEPEPWMLSLSPKTNSTGQQVGFIKGYPDNETWARQVSAASWFASLTYRTLRIDWLIGGLIASVRATWPVQFACLRAW